MAGALLTTGCGEKDEPAPGPPDDGGAVDSGDGRGGVRLEELGTFDSPVFLAQPNGVDSLFVVEQTGRIIRLEPEGRRSTFLDISRRISCCGEQGLLSVAFAPDFRRSGRFYVDYTNPAGDTRVVEYETRGRRADPRSARQVLAVAQPFSNHNGGLLLFGPDRRLYVGLGDGGSGGDPQRNGQDLTNLLGKILRIDPKRSKKDPYTIPRDNPFTNRGRARGEIAVYGVRNPWRFSFDRHSGELWIGDVGQSALEEIDLVDDPSGGANLGWSAFEGTERFNEDQRAPSALEPVLTYGRDLGCSVTGGYVVRDPELTSLWGRYLYADFCQGQLRSFAAAEAATDDRPLGLQVPSISSFAEDTEGRIYAISLDGPVYRLAPQ